MTDDAEQPHDGEWRTLRLVVAGLVVVGLTVIVLLSYPPFKVLQSCHQELANTGEAVEVCGPIGLNDVVAISLVLLIAGFFVWPDLSEFSVANLIALKRRVKDVEQVARKADAKATGATDDIRAQVIAEPPPPIPPAGQVQANEEAAEYAESDDATPASSPHSKRRVEAEADVHRFTRDIDQYLRFLASEPSETVPVRLRGSLLSPQSASRAYKALIEWQKDNEDALRTWAKLRNQVKHAPERLSDTQVYYAASVGRMLITEANKHLGPMARFIGASTRR